MKTLGLGLGMLVLGGLPTLGDVSGSPAVLAVTRAPGSATGPYEEGLRYFAQGRYAEAVGAFREALVADPDDPRLNYNLALALWRAGEADAAETAAEKAAALGDEKFEGLRDGILGNLRYDQARALAASLTAPQPPAPNQPPQPVPGSPAGAPPDEVQVLESALQQVRTSRNHFQRGALKLVEHAPQAGSELLRNLERAIRLEKELEKQLEEAKKRQQEQEKQDKDKQEKKDDGKKGEKKDDENKDDKEDSKKNDEKKSDDKKEDENKDPEKPDQDDPQKSKDQPEPDPRKKPEEENKDTQQPKQPEEEEKQDEGKLDPEDEKKNEPHEAKPPQQVPGEHDPTKELTPEQKAQLMKRLQEFEAKLQQLKAARQAARPKVKKDW